ncbi:tartrate dehydrogenase [Aureobasidium pullulans]|uniref:Tartrate dehydrogenase n=1 Tax=Aureobasidium pullulans TaxID=5580 RepID=A0A4T0BZK3_AURPU|nr:tartrate dehydrogenase [Aureobasidium pullulans]
MVSAKNYKIACIPADGIGPEVIDAGVTVLKALSAASKSFTLDFEHYDWSSETYKKTGKYIPDNGLEDLKKHDAILFDVPDHISLWGLRLAICQPFQQYANVRPTKILRGTESPLRKAQAGDLDWVIVRENSEGEYAGQGGRSHRGQPWEIATETSIFTRHAVTRLIKFAFEVAQKREKKHITVVTKSNAQRNGMVMWDEIAAEVAKDFPDVKCDKMLVDAMTCRSKCAGGAELVGGLASYAGIDVIALRWCCNRNHSTPSSLRTWYALSSLAYQINTDTLPARRHPLRPRRSPRRLNRHSTNLQSRPHTPKPQYVRTHPRLRLRHITGKGIANPVGTFWTAAEMLRWLGEETAADKLLDCVENVCGNGVMTKDLGGDANTKQVTDAVCEEIKRCYA